MSDSGTTRRQLLIGAANSTLADNPHDRRRGVGFVIDVSRYTTTKQRADGSDQPLAPGGLGCVPREAEHSFRLIGRGQELVARVCRHLDPGRQLFSGSCGLDLSGGRIELPKAKVMAR